MADPTEAAGELCDFVFGDPNNPTKLIDHATLYVTHTNDTGYALTEVDHVTVTFDNDAGTQKQVGVVWHLRDASGKIVLVQGRTVVFDAVGDVIKVTPNFNPDFAAVACLSGPRRTPGDLAVLALAAHWRGG